MIFIRHRVNTIADLQTVDGAHGAEIDLRSDVAGKGVLHLAHDPWARGENFEEWLKAFAARKLKGPVILNTKEDGLEERATELMQAHGLSNYFFLDTALPTLIRLTKNETKAPFAVRISSYEPIEAVAAFRGKAAWAWIDCFEGKPLPAREVARLKAAFRICLVSPELQKQPLEAIAGFKELFTLADAVCTKSPESWKFPRAR